MKLSGQKGSSTLDEKKKGATVSLTKNKLFKEHYLLWRAGMMPPNRRPEEDSPTQILRVAYNTILELQKKGLIEVENAYLEATAVAVQPTTWLKGEK